MCSASCVIGLPCTENGAFGNADFTYIFCVTCYSPCADNGIFWNAGFIQLFCHVLLTVCCSRGLTQRGSVLVYVSVLRGSLCHPQADVRGVDVSFQWTVEPFLLQNSASRMTTSLLHLVHVFLFSLG